MQIDLSLLPTESSCKAHMGFRELKLIVWSCPVH